MITPRLLIDTDPGVDGALAILMAHAHAEVGRLSIAGGNVGLAHTVGNALRRLDIMGADTPVLGDVHRPAQGELRGLCAAS